MASDSPTNTPMTFGSSPTSILLLIYMGTSYLVPAPNLMGSLCAPGSPFYRLRPRWCATNGGRTGEPLRLARKSENLRCQYYILRQLGVQEKNQLSLLSVEIRCRDVRKNFSFRAYKKHSTLPETAITVQIRVICLLFG